MARAVTPQMNVSESRAKASMMTDTWMLSSGELSTGIMLVMAGSICPMCDTSRKKPAMRNPKVRAMGNRRLAAIDSNITSHATSSMVS